MNKNNWIVLLILCIWFVISFVTNILGPMLPMIIDSFGLSLTLAAFLPFSFFLAYGIMSIPAGMIIERFGAKISILVDFSMTALDYLKSKERNINLGQQDSTRSWQPNITITLADNTVYPYKGYVDFAEPQVDPQTGTFSVRAEIPNPKQVLLPGQFTKVKLLLDVREGAIVVPMKAVTIEKGGAYIYTMRKDDTVEKRFIELGPEVGNNVVVERGLAVGETIVVEGFHKLTPGMKVRVSQQEMETKDNTKGE